MLHPCALHAEGYLLASHFFGLCRKWWSSWHFRLPETTRILLLLLCVSRLLLLTTRYVRRGVVPNSNPSGRPYHHTRSGSSGNFSHKLNRVQLVLPITPSGVARTPPQLLPFLTSLLTKASGGACSHDPSTSNAHPRPRLEARKMPTQPDCDMRQWLRFGCTVLLLYMHINNLYKLIAFASRGKRRPLLILLLSLINWV